MDDWRKRAACRDEDPELFFPIGKGETYRAQAARAKAICAACPVRDECLGFAFDTKAVGVFGGIDEDERRLMWRRMHRKAGVR